MADKEAVSGYKKRPTSPCESKNFQLLTSTKEYNKQNNVLEVSVLYAPANVIFLVVNFVQVKRAPVISKKG